MRFPLVFALIMLVVNAMVDLYIYRALYSYCRRRIWPHIQLVTSVVLALTLVVLCAIRKRHGDDTTLLWVMWLLYIYVCIYVPKYIFIIFDALSRLPILWKGQRRVWISWTGVGLGICTFGLMCWGLVNRYNLEVRPVDVEIVDLPATFDGYRIVQISDLHLLSYASDTSYVSRLVDKVNDLHPDAIFFTGDLVSRRACELRPFMSTLSRLHATDGVFSITGNHDYGDYYDWDTEPQHLADLQTLENMQTAMGWQMLNNDHAWICRGNDSIAVIGVENFGDPPFKVFGDLLKAYPTPGDAYTKVLLTHNPCHWDQKVANHNYNIALTMAGHTHAMQVELMGLSPAFFRYRHWGGMYTDNRGQRLYVNRGIGTVGFPARIGATPEITLFTLNSVKK